MQLAYADQLAYMEQLSNGDPTSPLALRSIHSISDAPGPDLPSPDRTPEQALVVKTFGSPVAVAPNSAGSRQPSTPPLTAENLARAQAAAEEGAGAGAAAEGVAGEGGPGCRTPDTAMSRQPLAGLITPLEIKVSRLSAKLLVSDNSRGTSYSQHAPVTMSDVSNCCTQKQR
jgi:hypothetical protein